MVEWQFIKSSSVSWFWLVHRTCGAYIWSNWCDCGIEVPRHVVLQAQLLADNEDFSIWDGKVRL